MKTRITLLLLKAYRLIVPFRRGKWPIRQVRGAFFFRFAEPAEKVTRPLSMLLKGVGYTFGDTVVVSRFADLNRLTNAAHDDIRSPTAAWFSIFRDAYGRVRTFLVDMPAPPTLTLTLRHGLASDDVRSQLSQAGFRYGEALVAITQADWQRLTKLAAAHSGETIMFAHIDRSMALWCDTSLMRKAAR